MEGAGKYGFDIIWCWQRRENANDIINNFIKKNMMFKMFIDSNKEGEYCNKKNINVKDIESVNKKIILS